QTSSRSRRSSPDADGAPTPPADGPDGGNRGSTTVSAALAALPPAWRGAPPVRGSATWRAVPPDPPARRPAGSGGTVSGRYPVVPAPRNGGWPLPAPSVPRGPSSADRQALAPTTRRVQQLSMKPRIPSWPRSGDDDRRHLPSATESPGAG